jgi:hypothetical protein
LDTCLIARARTLSVTEVICKACYALVQEEEERATIAKYVKGLVGGGEEERGWNQFVSRVACAVHVVS